MQDIKLIIAKNISALRTEESITQLELAERLNYSDKAVSKWERGESIPDVTVLMEIAKMFGVTLDYLVQSEHPKEARKLKNLRIIHNHAFITGISMVLVWLIATLLFVVIDSTPINTSVHWLAFVYAVPATLIVWLIFNSIWFNKHRNFLIITLLLWACLASVYITLLIMGRNLWLIFTLGVPAQFIILMWSRIRGKNKNKE